MITLDDFHTVIIVEESSIDAWMEWRIQVGRGEMRVKVYIPNYEQLSDFKRKLEHHGYHFLEEDKSVLITTKRG